MATDSRVTPTGLIRVTTPGGEAYIDPAAIVMIGKGNADGASVFIRGLAANPVMVSEAPSAVLSMLKEGRAVQAVLGRRSMDEH